VVLVDLDPKVPHVASQPRVSVANAWKVVRPYWNSSEPIVAES
jgi:hypothetical protein